MHAVHRQSNIIEEASTAVTRLTIILQLPGPSIIYVKIFRYFSQSLLATIEIMGGSRPGMSPSLSLTIHYTLLCHWTLTIRS